MGNRTRTTRRIAGGMDDVSPTSPSWPGLQGLKLLRRSRASLCASTALQAAALVALAGPAAAQLAASARPSGGQVSAGQATIATAGNTTTVNQASQNAAINWQSYDVGSGQTVRYAQPNAASFTLNRVIAAHPSQIAGHIVANGRVAIVNQSGVVFLNGSTVDTAGLVVSAAGITDQDFMAGRLVFGAAPRPGAAISNAGNITVRQAGLAALVAPQVANSGIITAQLGRVVLGGATTHTLDLYGDGLVALNVTGQVTQVQVGGKSVTALVTNTGTILAPGGTVVLTAQAADGVVSTAVSAGGTIAAPSVGAQAGRVLVSGIGGDVEIDGAVTATGAQPGSPGGQIEVNGTRGVTVAAGALLDASGSAGGGVIAVGTTVQQALGGASVQPAMVAATTQVASGAVLRADATLRGHGGHVAVHARGAAQVHGTASVLGGPLGGDGGTLDFAGATLLADGVSSAAAPLGQKGQARFSVTGDLTVKNSCAGILNCLLFSALTGTYASAILDLDGSITFAGSAGSTLTSTAPTGLVLQTVFDAAPAGHTGDIVVQNGLKLVAPSFTFLSAGDIQLGGTLATSGTGTGQTVSLSAAGAVTEHPAGPGSTGSIVAGTLAILRADTVLLDGAANQVPVLDGASPVTGDFTFTDNSGLSVTAPVAAGGNVSITVTGVANGVVNRLTTSSTIASGTLAANGASSVLSLTASGDIVLGGAVDAGAGAGTAVLTTTDGGAIGQNAGIVTAASLGIGTSGAGNAVLFNANAIGTLTTGAVGGQLILATAGPLAVAAGATVEGSGGVTLAIGGAAANGTLTQGAGSTIGSNADIDIGDGSLVQGAARLLAGAGVTIDGSVVQTGQSLISGASVGIGAADHPATGLAQDDSTIQATGPAPLVITLAGQLAQTATGTFASPAGIDITGGELLLGGRLDAPLLTLVSAGGIEQSVAAGGAATGSIVTGTLSAQAGTGESGARNLVLDGSNTIGTVGLASATGSLTLDDTTDLILAAGGKLTAGGDLLIALTEGRTVTEDAGTGTEIASFGGVTLDAALVQQAGTGLSAQQGVLVTGDVTQQAGATIAAAGAATIDGGLSQAGGTVTAGTALLVQGSVDQSGGTIAGGSVAIGQPVDGTLSTAAAFSQRSASQLLATGGGIAILVNGAITQDQASVVRSQAGTLALTSTGGSLQLGGTIQATGGGTVALTAEAGGIAQTIDGSAGGTGTVLAGTLTASAGGDVLLDTAGSAVSGNQVGTLGASSAGGRFVFVDGQALSVAGALQAAGVVRLVTPSLDVAKGGSIAVTTSPGTVSLAADTYTIDGAVVAPDGLVALGLLHAGPFSVAADGTIDAASLGHVSTLAPDGTLGTLALGTTDALAVGGNTQTSGGTWVSATSGSVSSLTIGSALNLVDTGTAGALGLFSGGNVTETGQGTLASVVTGALFGTAGGNILLRSTANGIDTIGASGSETSLRLSSLGSIAVTDGTNLAIATDGTVTAAGGINLTLTGNGTLTQRSGSTVQTPGPLFVDAALFQQDGPALLQSTGGTVAITGSVDQAGGGTIIGGTVAIGADGAGRTLTQAADGSATTIRATSGNVAIALSGPVDQSATGTIVSDHGDVSLLATGVLGGMVTPAGLTLAGTLSAQAGTVSLQAAHGSITQGATGVLLAGTLAVQAGAVQGGAAYDVQLDGARNAFATLSGLPTGGTLLSGASGTLSIEDSSSLTVAQSVLVQAGTLDLHMLAGTLSIAGTLQGGMPAGGGTGGAVVLSADAGDIVETATGAMLAETLNANAGRGAVALGAPGGNVVTRLVGSNTALGGFSLADNAASLPNHDFFEDGSIRAGSIDLAVQAGNLNLEPGSVTQPGAVLTAAGRIGLSADLGVLQFGGAVTANTVAVAAGEEVAQFAGAAIVGASTGTGPSITLQAGTLDAAAGFANDVALPAGAATVHGIALGGLVMARAAGLGSVTLSTPGGDITQASPASGTAGVILADNLAFQAGTPGLAVAVPRNVLLTSGGNQIGTLTGIGGLSGAAGAVSLVDATDLAVAPGVTLSAAGDLTMALAGHTLTQLAGSTLAAAGAATLDAALFVQTTQASLDAGFGLSTTGAVLQQSLDAITATGGQIAVAHGLDQFGGSTLSAEAGGVSLGTLGQTGSSVTAATSLTVGGDATQQAGSSLHASGDVTIGRSLTQLASAAEAGGVLTLLGGGTLIQSGASLLSGDAGVNLALGTGLSQDATSALVSPGGNIAIRTSGGTIAFAGTIGAPGADGHAVSLVADTGSIESMAGTLIAGTLAASAARDLHLDGTANQVAVVAPSQLADGTSLAGLSAGGTLSLSDSLSLRLAGATAAGSDVTFRLAASLLEDAGSMIAGTDANSAVQISAPGTLAFLGGLAAPHILLGEHLVGDTILADLAAPSLVTWGGGTIQTGSSIPIPAPGLEPDIAQPITGGTGTQPLGLFVQAANITQSGTTLVTGGAQQTVQLSLTGPGGAILFDPGIGAADGLIGPGTQLLLDLQANGTARGNIVVAGLNIFYAGLTPSAEGASLLTGSVDGRTGTSAAATAFVHASQGVNYQLNGCPIQSVNCVLLSPVLVPLGSPVRDLEVSVVHRRDDDDDLILPNVAEQDY